MPEKIQRVPRGLNELLSLSGGQTPQQLEDRVAATVDLLQFYGLTQLQSTSGANAAAAEGAGCVLGTPSSSWFVLFGVRGVVVKTATMTALNVELRMTRSGSAGLPVPLFWASLEPFGATETGSVAIGGFLTYPLVCPPGTTMSFNVNILGTDATANISGSAEFCVLS